MRKTPGRKVLAPKVYEEGYCCLYGYLTLCKARGESRKDMAFFLSIPKYVVRDGYNSLHKGVHRCLKGEGCLEKVIQELENDKDSF